MTGWNPCSGPACAFCRVEVPWCFGLVLGHGRVEPKQLCLPLSASSKASGLIFPRQHPCLCLHLARLAASSAPGSIPSLQMFSQSLLKQKALLHKSLDYNFLGIWRDSDWILSV